LIGSVVIFKGLSLTLVFLQKAYMIRSILFIVYLTSTPQLCPKFKNAFIFLVKLYA